MKHVGNEQQAFILDHFGIIAQVCKEIRLQDVIDRAIGTDIRQKVTPGAAVVSMVLNCFGFVNNPLYLSPQFLENLPVERLIGPGLTPEMFNDDLLGRTLEKIAEHGTEKLFMDIALQAYKRYNLEPDKVWHLDTTSVSVEGEYEGEGKITITKGFSKDHRPDLKQFMVGLLTNKSIPLVIQTLSGNTSDKTYFRELPLTLGRELADAFGGGQTLIMDSAFFSKENVQAVTPHFNWITSVPMTIKEAKDLRKNTQTFQKTTVEGYETATYTMDYGGIDQRWIVVKSKKRAKQAKKKLEERIDKEYEKISKEVWHFSNKTFESKQDGKKALQRLAKKWKFFRLGTVTYEEKRVKKTKGRGRPRKDAPVKLVYSLSCTIEKDEETIAHTLHQAGTFILATSWQETYSAEEILTLYKSQQHVERGFRFLKDPLFFAEGIYLKNPDRIMALLMVMGIALLIYSITELRLRTAIAASQQPFPDPYRAPSLRPTLRHVLRYFRGIIVMYTPSSETTKVFNLKAEHSFVLEHLGADYVAMYT